MSCPRCGEPFDDDGDRIYDDCCAYCGWATPERREQDRKNDETFAQVRAMAEAEDQFAITRKLVVQVRLAGEEDARTCAAMLSLLGKAQRANKPCPGYVGLLRCAKQQEQQEPTNQEATNEDVLGGS